MYIILLSLLIFPSISHASEGNPVIWLMVFPVQYLFLLASFFMVKLGFRRKTLLVVSFTFGHFIFVSAFDSVGRWIYEVPDLILALLPSIYWILLMVIVALLKKYKVFEDNYQP